MLRSNALQRIAIRNWPRGLVGPKKTPHTPSSASFASASSSSSPSILRNPLQWYVSKLDTHPLTTKCITSGLIAGSGDLTCQYLSSQSGSSTSQQQEEEEGAIVQKNQSTIDPIRTLRFFTLGSLFVAPVIHLWYGFLMTSIPGSSISVIVKRLFFDQALFAPIFLPTFISGLTFLEHFTSTGDEHNSLHNHGDDLYSRVLTRLQNDVPDALVVNWFTWIPAMAFMFRYVPGKFQVLYSNCIGFFWNGYLSWRTHEGEREEGGEPKE